MYSFIWGCYLTIFFLFFSSYRNRYYYWNTITDQVCWLSPVHPRANITVSAQRIQGTDCRLFRFPSPLPSLKFAHPIECMLFYFQKNSGGKKGLSLVKGPMKWGSVRVFIRKHKKKLRGSPRARWKWQMNDFNGTLLLTRFASWWFNPAIVQFISVLLCDRRFSFHDLLQISLVTRLWQPGRVVMKRWKQMHLKKVMGYVSSSS